MVDDPVAAPETVKVCAVFQFAVVKVSLAGSTVAAAFVPLLGVTTTWLLGFVSSTTV